jgi:peptidoglycan LD-endopeptidase LytH
MPARSTPPLQYNLKMTRVKRVTTAAYLVVVHLLLAYMAYELIRVRYAAATTAPDDVPPITEPEIRHTPEPEPTPCVINEITAPPEALPSITPSAGQSRQIVIPVAGVNANQLTDTFTASRSGGTRSHDAIDIMAPAGTPVLAAVTGQIVRFFDSVPGGITIYQLSEDGKYIYYYGHLQKRADDVKPGDKVTQGKTIGYVGDSGNAGAGNYHLHFSIARVTDPKRYWSGTYVNPYPYLVSGTVPD